MNPSGTLNFTKSGEAEIVMTRSFDAPRALVFDALTKPELVKRWLLGPPGWSLPVCDIALKVGGAFRYVWRNADGREMGMGGVFHEIVPPECIVHTELFDDDWTGGETLVTNFLTEHSGKTTLSVTVRYQTPDARDTVLGSGMEEGVAMSYDRLAELLTSATAA